MSTVSVSQILLERLISTHGLAVRNDAQDEAFWYTSGKPGPFYINTEKIAGEQEAADILEDINELLKAPLSKQQQAGAFFAKMNQLVAADEAYSASIDALLDYYESHAGYKPAFISGGERRDWFFSIPVARRLKLPHVFLFKSGEHVITDHEGKPLESSLLNQKVLHVADIINQASSYLNRWIPILQNTGAAFTETLTVAVRSQEGLASLKQHHIRVVSPLTVDRPLFTEAYELGLINEFAYNEISKFYDSPEAWTQDFLRENTRDYGQNSNLDTKTKERIAYFKAEDPYQLKSEFPAFFN
jgi:orotate phosphoribosyltransferase